MNSHEPKPPVAPPAAYKPPSIPTLAMLGAVGVISAAALSGCNFSRRSQYQSKPIDDFPIGGLPAYEETQLNGFYLDGDIITLPEESQ